jgi:CRISP-associated protein Cas1
VALIQLNWRGEVISVCSGPGYAPDAEIFKAQVEFQNNSRKFEVSNKLIISKIENSISTIDNVFPHSPEIELALTQLRGRVDFIRKKPPTNLNALRGVEGHAAAIYFGAWHSRPLNWKGLGKKPIPENWHRICPRPTTDKGNQFARHPVNAMLNYAYGILKNQIQTTILAMGFEPTIGFMHAPEGNRPTLVLDLIEPMRPIIDREILAFIQTHVFSPSDFILNKMGVCKLHPQFARTVVKLVQDIQEIETATANNLRKILISRPAIMKKASKNMDKFKARIIGRRE